MKDICNFLNLRDQYIPGIMPSIRAQAVIAQIAVIIAIFAWIVFMPQKTADILAPRAMPDISTCMRDHCCCDSHARFIAALSGDDCCDRARYVIPIGARGLHDVIHCARYPCESYM